MHVRPNFVVSRVYVNARIPTTIYKHVLNLTTSVLLDDYLSFHYGLSEG